MKYIMALVMCLVVGFTSTCFAQYASPYGNPYTDSSITPNPFYDRGASSYAAPHPSGRVDVIVRDHNTGETKILPGEYSRDGRSVYGYDRDKMYIESAPRPRY
jgi:hypothetical protein